MHKKVIALISALCLGGCSLVGCSSPTDEKKLDEITIAEVTHSVFYAPQYAAITEGFFEQEGIKIDLIDAQGADKTMTALISGEADIGLMGPEASIYVYKQGSKDYAINFAGLTKRDGSFIVSREKNDNFSYDDMKGKEILGGRAGGVPLMTLEYLLKNKGLEIGKGSDKVNVRSDVQFGVMAGAFAAGEADYTTAFEPTATQLVKEGSGYVVASVGEDAGEIPFTCYCATKSYMDENSDLIKRFTRALYNGQKWVQNASDEEIAKSMQPFFKDTSLEDLKIVAHKYKEIDAWSSDPLLKEESLNRLMDVMIEGGELDEKVPYDAVVTTKYAEDAMK